MDFFTEKTFSNGTVKTWSVLMLSARRSAWRRASKRSTPDLHRKSAHELGCNGVLWHMPRQRLDAAFSEPQTTSRDHNV